MCAGWRSPLFPRRAWLTLAACVAILAGAGGASAQVQSVPLYDGAAPGSPEAAPERVVVERGDNVRVYNTSQPIYALHLPPPEQASGAAVVMLAGGALRFHGLGAGMQAEIDALVAHGVAVILVEYRTLPMTMEEIERSSAPPPPDAPPPTFPRMEIRNGNANPAPGDPAVAEVLRLATLDAQTALRMAHENAVAWNLDPDRIGIMGTSAGGGVGFAALMADAPDQEKPDFLISIYGPSLVDIVPPAGEAPPLFMAVEADHGPVTDGLLAAFSIWKSAGQKAELHVYEVPNFTMTVDLWGPRLFAWMQERGILSPAE